MAKHICGQTGREFDTKQEYLEHVSEKTGFKPTEIEHQGRVGVLISKSALRRTNSLNEELEQDLNDKAEELRGLKK